MSDPFPTKIDAERIVAEFQRIADTLCRACETLSQRLAEHQHAVEELIEQYRLASTPTPEESTTSDWHEWRGGFMPVPTDALVEIRRKSGKIESGHASSFNWRHYQSAGTHNIEAYRVISNAS